MTASALYLFQQAGVDPSRDSSQEVLSRKARILRGTIARWWGQLEPGATAGIPVTVLEGTLVAMARAVARNYRQVVGHQWVRWRLGSKLRGIATTTTNPKVLGECFLGGLERLGVLSRDGVYVSFTHPILMELYLGLGLAMDNTLPKKIAGKPRTSLERVQTSEGLSVVARLGLADSEDLDSLVQMVAEKNLHLVAWFLHFNDEAREEWGERLADEILGEFGWDLDLLSRSQLTSSLAGLGPEALVACRSLVDEEKGGLPAILTAIDLIGESGTGEDVARLRRLMAGEDPGYWEIVQLRQRLREATEIVADKENQNRFAREDKIDTAKGVAGCLLSIAGAAATYQKASHKAHNLPVSFQLQLASGTMSKLGKHLIAAKGSDFYQQQVELRRLMATLPKLIEQRKAQISERTPEVMSAAQAAIAKLESRTEPPGAQDPSLGWPLPHQPRFRTGSPRVPTVLTRPVKCSFCGHEAIPVVKKTLSNTGWMWFSLLLVCCFPIALVLLLSDGLKKEVPVCASCGNQLAPDIPSLTGATGGAGSRN